MNVKHCPTEELIIRMQARQLVALRLEVVQLEKKLAEATEERDMYRQAVRNLSDAHQKSLKTAR